MPKDTSKRASRARALYVQGLSVPEVAEALCVSEATVYRYRQGDESRGRSWDEQRQEHDIADLRDVIAVLVRRLRELADNDTIDTPAWADALQKLVNSLSRILDLYGDATSTLMAMGRFAKWAAAELPDADLEMVRRAVASFLANLKEELT